jgi:predicted Zn-dependent protease
MNERELLDALERALPADGEVELSAMGGRQRMLRFASSRFTQTGDVEDVVVQARAIEGGRLGAARTNRVDAASLRDLVAEARAMAKAQRGPAGAPGFADGRAPEPKVAPSFDEATARADAAGVARLVEPAFAACGRTNLTAAGLVAAGVTTWAVATTAGARRLFSSTSARLDIIASDESSAARVGRYATAIGVVAADATALADDAVSRAERGRAPIDLPPGAYDVILEPPAVAELLEWLALTSLGARTLEDGSSCLAGRRGQTITGDVTISDDALSGADGCPTLPFDAEGTPKQRVVSIDAGRVGDGVHDRASAARFHTASTGHAGSVGDELGEGGPSALHLHVQPGADTIEDLLGRVERGLWVSRFHYVNGLLDTRRALMTGMTRDGLFLVENGRLGRGVRNLRWTESLLEAFQRLGGLSRARQVVAAGLSGQVLVCPTVLVRGWRFTGTSR